MADRRSRIRTLRGGAGCAAWGAFAQGARGHEGAILRSARVRLHSQHEGAAR